ncbi:hypothetical protein D3C72_1130910 [compost metagenome]
MEAKDGDLHALGQRRLHLDGARDVGDDLLGVRRDLVAELADRHAGNRLPGGQAGAHEQLHARLQTFDQPLGLGDGGLGEGVERGAAEGLGALGLLLAGLALEEVLAELGVHDALVGAVQRGGALAHERIGHQAEIRGGLLGLRFAVVEGLGHGDGGSDGDAGPDRPLSISYPESRVLVRPPA